MESEIDAIFFRLVHQLSNNSPTEEDLERRAQPRTSFLTRQRIAPWDGGGCPDQSQFFEVRCYDLTQSGFSFLAANRPAFTSLVAEFGAAPDLIYVAAQIVHFSNVLVYPNGTVEHVQRPADDSVEEPNEEPAADERPSRNVLVGCRFTRRVPRPLWLISR